MLAGVIRSRLESRRNPRDAKKDEDLAMTQTQALLEDLTVGQLVVERPSRARLFERLGIDYCCGGKKPLALACQEKGLDLATVLAELDRDTTGPAREDAAADRNWATASMTDLADHIERTHHAFLKSELPRLEPIAHKVAVRHGPNHPELAELYEVFMGLKQEMESHMMKEERILFPLCRKLDAADGPEQFHCGSVANPIAVMINEHEDAGRALQRMRELTNDFTPPPDACPTFRGYLDSLRQIEEDMHQHVHKENNILFPKAVRTEGLLRNAGR